tara:strand:+ start:868 stop:1263 length:396 start_codon:yes stop_codon:yes gene_type:complete
MITLLEVSFYLFCILLTGWTLATYCMRRESQKLIREELKNLFEISKTFVVSLKTLLGILKSHSFYAVPRKTYPEEQKILNEDEKPLSLVEPITELETTSVQVPLVEDDDTALSSFSPEVVEVINEEEEKVA